VKEEEKEERDLGQAGGELGRPCVEKVKEHRNEGERRQSDDQREQLHPINTLKLRPLGDYYDPLSERQKNDTINLTDSRLCLLNDVNDEKHNI